MARRRRAIHKKPRRRRPRSRADDDEDEDEDDDYVAGEEDGESESSSDSDVSPRGSSDEESFQFSSSDEEAEEIEVAAPKRRRSAAPRNRKRRPRFSDDEEEEAISASRAESRRRRPGALDLEEEDDDDDDEDEDFTPDNDEEISPVAKRKSNSGKKGTAKRRKSNGRKRRKSVAAAPARKRRRRAVPCIDDDDFIVEDSVLADKKKSKKVKKRKKTASRKTRKRSLVDTASSDSDFVVSNDDLVANDNDGSDSDLMVSDDDDFTVKKQDRIAIGRQRKKSGAVKKKSGVARKKRTVPKTRKKRRSVDSDSSDFDYIVPEEEVRDLGIVGNLDRQKARKLFVKREGEEKGKEKEPDVSEKQICGICLSEQQKGTIQGVLNCCAHYFCFACIMEWSKVESRCPVCKRRFVTISKSPRLDPGFGMRKAVIRVQKRDQVYQPSEEEITGLLDPYENVVCMVCQQGGDDNLMLLCDICDSSAHTYCAGLGREVPEGNWYCEGCRSTDDGSSNSQVQDTAIDQETSSNDLFSRGIETEDLSTIMHSNTNSRQSVSFSGQSASQRIDLNVSPRHLSEEDHGVAAQVSGAGASTPSGRRAIHQHLRVRLSNGRSRQRGDLFSGSSNSQVQDTPVDQGTSSRPRQRGNLFSGSSNSQVQDSAVDQGTSSSNLFSGGNGIATEDLSTNMHASTNCRQSVSFPGQSSSQRIDLNVSPRHLLGEDHGVATQASGAVASTLSGRRAIHQRIRILLSNSRPRQILATTDAPCRNVESDVITSEVGQGRGTLHVSEGLNPLHTVSATERHHQNSRPIVQSNAYLAPCMFGEESSFRHVEGAKEQVQSMVKSHLKNLSRGILPDRETFKEIARRSTHTILAACGIEHRRSVVAVPIQPPNKCSHDLDDGPTNLMKGCCSSCFSSFARDVVQKLINTASKEG